MKFKMTLKPGVIDKLKVGVTVTQVTEKALDLSKQELLKNLMLEAAQAKFKNDSGAYVQSIKVERKRGYLHIYSTHPAAMAIEYGFKEERPMKWLVTGNAIAFKLENGKTIVRKVTDEMIGRPSEFSQSGKSWTYPKMDGKFIFTKALKKSMPEIKRHLGRIFKLVVED